MPQLNDLRQSTSDTPMLCMNCMSGGTAPQLLIRYVAGRLSKAIFATPLPVPGRSACISTSASSNASMSATYERVGISVSSPSVLPFGNLVRNFSGNSSAFLMTSEMPLAWMPEDVTPIMASPGCSLVPVTSLLAGAMMAVTQPESDGALFTGGSALTRYLSAGDSPAGSAMPASLQTLRKPLARPLARFSSANHSESPAATSPVYTTGIAPCAMTSLTAMSAASTPMPS